MRILYGIQGTGNGHISRARTFLPLLEKVAEVDVLLSGSSSEVKLGRPVTYHVHGLGYTFGSNGGIDFLDSARKLRPVRLMRDIKSLPVQKYDLIISDFEPVSARAATRANKMCIALSHQAAFISPKSPRPAQRSLIGEYIFSRYAPCSRYIGFHYQRYDRTISTPVIGGQIRQIAREKHPGGNHATVYLPSYHDRRLLAVLEKIPQIDWHVFSKKAKYGYQRGHVSVYPVDHDAYIRSLARCRWLICGAGFEAPSEGLYLGKPMLVVPMAWQYEQQCNAAALERMGVTVLQSFGEKMSGVIADWLDSAEPVHIPYPDQSEYVVSKIMNMYEVGITGTRFAV